MLHDVCHGTYKIKLSCYPFCLLPGLLERSEYVILTNRLARDYSTGDHSEISNSCVVSTPIPPSPEIKEKSIYVITLRPFLSSTVDFCLVLVKWKIEHAQTQSE